MGDTDDLDLRKIAMESLLQQVTNLEKALLEPGGWRSLQVRNTKKAARSAGFDADALALLVRLREMSPEKQQVFDLYRTALGGQDAT